MSPRRPASRPLGLNGGPRHGDWVEAASGQTSETINPATEEVLSEVAHGQAQDIERAVTAARRAFDDDSPWRRMNASDRGRLIWRDLRAHRGAR